MIRNFMQAKISCFHVKSAYFQTDLFHTSNALKSMEPLSLSEENVYPNSLRFRSQPLFQPPYTTQNRIHSVLDWVLGSIHHSELNSQCFLTENFHFLVFLCIFWNKNMKNDIHFILSQYSTTYCNFRDFHLFINHFKKLVNKTSRSGWPYRNIGKNTANFNWAIESLFL